MSIASELTNYATYLENAYGAAEDKGATIPANKNLNNLSTAIDSIEEKQDVVNGIIEQYKASTSDISADTFVEFVNGTFDDGIAYDIDTKLSTAANSYEYASAVLVDTDKVFIAHRNGSYLYGIVCTISGTTITAGTDTQLSTVSNSYYYASAVLADTNKVFIAHRNGSFLYGIICTISGTTITSGTDTCLSTSSGSYAYASAALIDTDKLFIAHPGNDGNYLYGVVCTISGTTITAGTDTQLSTASNSYYYASAVLIDTDKVFVAHAHYYYDSVYYSVRYYLRGIVCTISGTTITAGTVVSLPGEALFVSAVPMGANKVFVAHKTSSYLYGVVCTISGTAITAGTDTKLSTVSSSYYYASAVLIDTDKVFIAHRGSNYLYGVVCAISGTTITAGTDTKLSTVPDSYYYASAVLADVDKVFITHRGSDGSTKTLLHGMVCTPPITIEAASTKIEGITKTACTTSTAGDVWVLDTSS